MERPAAIPVESHPQEDRQRLRVLDQVPAPETAGLLREAMEPLETDPGHPGGRPRHLTSVEREGRADADCGSVVVLEVEEHERLD